MAHHSFEPAAAMTAFDFRSDPRSNETLQAVSAVSQEEVLHAKLAEMSAAHHQTYYQPTYFDHTIRDVVPFFQCLVQAQQSQPWAPSAVPANESMLNYDQTN